MKKINTVFLLAVGLLTCLTQAVAQGCQRYQSQKTQQLCMQFTHSNQQAQVQFKQNALQDLKPLTPQQAKQSKRKNITPMTNTNTANNSKPIAGYQQRTKPEKKSTSSQFKGRYY